MLVHCLRRWPSIGPTLGRCLVFAGKQSWQQVSVMSQCYVTLTALSRHWRDAGGAGNTRECDNSVDGPTLLSVASHHDTLSLTKVSPRWWVSDRPTNYYTLLYLNEKIFDFFIARATVNILLRCSRAKLRFLWERPDDFFFCGEPWHWSNGGPASLAVAQHWTNIFFHYGWYAILWLSILFELETNLHIKMAAM